MDIDLLSKMVKELILDNDKVVLPGLGCFVAEIVPSTFSDKGYTINPPYRKLSFRAKPDRGDDLAKFYADTNNVGYDVADRIMTDFVAELKAVLHQKKTVVFPALGRLRATKENTVFFVADENLDIYPAGFGLEPVSLKTHHQTREEVSAAIEGLRSIIDDSPESSAPVSASEDKPYPHQDAPCEPENVAVQEAADVSADMTARDDSWIMPSERPEETSVFEAEEAACTSSEALPEPACNMPDGEKDALSSEGSRPAVWKIVLLTIAAIVAFMVVAMGIYMALAIYAPEFLDSLLYTQEELDIINCR